MIHNLKIEKNYLVNLLDGIKKSEVRFNDRDYQRGDIVRFTSPIDGKGGMNEHLFEITHIHSGLGLKEGYVILSLKKLD